MLSDQIERPLRKNVPCTSVRVFWNLTLSEATEKCLVGQPTAPAWGPVFGGSLENKKPGMATFSCDNSI